MSNIINTRNLSEGEIFKNYKALCEALNEKVKTGYSKQAQLKEWEGYFTYLKDKNKFIILKILDDPIVKVEQRGGNNKLAHADKMDEMLTYILSKQEDGELLMTINRLLLEMKMINENFTYGNYNQNKVSNYLDIKEAYIEEFFHLTKRTFKSNIDSMLDRLERKSMIYWNKVKTVCIGKGDVTEEHRLATKDEIQLIMQVEDEVMIELGCEDKQDIVKKEMWKYYKKEVNKVLTEKANIMYYYDSYNIIRNVGKLTRIANKVELTHEHVTLMVELNQAVQKQIITNMERRSKKSLEEVKSGVLKTFHNMRTNEKYLENGTIMIDTFINPKCECIMDEIR
ncbi:hypothetical protein [Peribacillus frigoritolerans]|uniref:hypothetical protein n=1 Tax=Peribacillus frigoritolerans TaxID=450367 RepID=UPI0025A0AE1E|nr:hypothetical protein [Peribacillus frigoritolerans]MDM5306320.1 hypothetical protein [Peribacillus frigoritolerans]